MQVVLRQEQERAAVVLEEQVVMLPLPTRALLVELVSHTQMETNMEVEALDQANNQALVFLGHMEAAQVNSLVLTMQPRVVTILVVVVEDFGMVHRIILVVLVSLFCQLRRKQRPPQQPQPS
jgi:hypothetical protein